ncbi:MAG: hypothetical protein IJV73_00660 [Clostridia bacterium]|nr:hypothetical protein [Clostridia bacterium]
MKTREKKVNIKVKPQRITRAERQRAKFAEMANEELQLCLAAGEFHKAYLDIELGCEEEKFEELKERLAELEAEREKAAIIQKQRRKVPRKEVIEF